MTEPHLNSCVVGRHFLTCCFVHLVASFSLQLASIILAGGANLWGHPESPVMLLTPPAQSFSLFMGNVSANSVRHAHRFSACMQDSAFALNGGNQSLM